MRQSLLIILLATMLPITSHARGQKQLKHWHVTPANYSGITPIGQNLYAVVSDKETHTGFYVWQILQDDVTGGILSVEEKGFRADPTTASRDNEDIAFVPGTGCVWITGEADQRIVEHRIADGKVTGRELDIPQSLSIRQIQRNRGFEALGYDAHRRVLWTCPESAPKGCPPLSLPLVSFGTDGKLRQQYTYPLSAPKAKSTGRDYYHGVVAITPLPDGTLLFLEREALITQNYLGSRCWCAVYRFVPETGEKSLVEEWSTRLGAFSLRFANYEGMCLGATTSTGEQTILLISDSQAHYGKALWHLRDYIRVLRIPL